MENVKLMIEDGKLVGFEGTPPVHLVVPEGVREIGVRAFLECYELESVVIPNSCRCIHILAFECCINLRSVLFPDNGLTVQASAFDKCLSLMELEIPSTANIQGEFNFYAHWHEKETVEVPKYVTTLKRKGANGLWIKYAGKEYMHMGVFANFYQCDAIQFYDHVKWNMDINDQFYLCNKLILCEHETKKVKRVLWINGHDAGQWGKWRVHKYLTEFCNVKDGEVILKGYDMFVMTLASMKDKCMAMMYRLCYPVDLSEADKANFVEYLKKNRKKAMQYVIDNGDVELVYTADKIGLVTTRNVAGLTQYAMEQGKAEMAAALQEWRK